MALLKVTSDELINVALLVEDIFPGADLEPTLKVLEGLDLSGSFKIAKSLGNGERISLEIVVEDSTP